MKWDLPMGWRTARIEDVCSKITDGTHVTPKYVSEGIPFVSTTNIKPFKTGFGFSEYRRFITPKAYEELTRSARPERGDILISKCGTIGRTKEVDVDFPFSIFVGLALLKVQKQTFYPSFLEYLLNSPAIATRFEELAPGSTRRTLTLKAIKSVEIPVPPYDEQRKIVDVLHRLTERSESCQSHLARVPLILKRFRQSVLAAACSGRLTEDWRQGKVVVESEDGSSDDRPSVPGSWTWRTLKEVAQLRGGVTKGRHLNGKKTVKLPYLRVANVQDGYIDLREVKEIDILPEEHTKYVLKKGDILFTEGGDRDKLGRGAVWQEEIEGCIHQNHIFRARLQDPNLLPEYVSIVTKSDFSRQYFFENASQTVNLASINLSTLSALPIPVPPIEEQAVIVKRVQDLLGLAEGLDDRTIACGAKVGSIRVTLLAKAFRGVLVINE